MSETKRRHACLVTHHDGGPARAQAYPFFLYADELAERCGLTFSHYEADCVAGVRAAVATQPCDLVLVQGPCLGNDDFEEKVELLRSLRRAVPVVLLETADSCRGRDLGLLPFVDRFLAKAVYRDPEFYRRPFIDGRPFADELVRCSHPKRWFANWRFLARHLFDGEIYFRYLARSLRKNLAGAPFTREGIPDPKLAPKIVQGWSLGSHPKLAERFRKQGFRPLQKEGRSIDVHCRVSTKAGFFCDWYYFHRESAMDALKPLSRKYSVLASRSHVDREAFLDELTRARIVVSPFGWGEVCYRDFEAVLSGCLLVKPAMEHLSTVPDIYQPGITYVPVRWDFADLAEKCRHYLRHREERERMVRAAGEAYANFFQENRVIAQTQMLLQELP